MNSRLASFLRDFDAESAPPVAMQFDMPSAIHLPAELPAPDFFEAPVDIEAERREAAEQAFEEGRKAAEEALTAKHAEDLAALEEKHAAEIEAQRLQFEGGIADYLATALPDLAQRVSSELADAAARLLLPLVQGQAERVAVEEMAAQLKQTLSREVLEQVRVSGPERLCDLLRSQLEEKGETIEFTPSDETDLRVEIGDALLVTRLSVFAAELEKVLA